MPTTAKPKAKRLSKTAKADVMTNVMIRSEKAEQLMQALCTELFYLALDSKPLNDADHNTAVVNANADVIITMHNLRLAYADVLKKHF